MLTVDKAVEREGVLNALGVRATVNACGVYTDLGGSRLTPGVWAAMAEVNESFVALPELLERTGAHIAGRFGAPAAQVTPGAAAAIMLGTAAAMAGSDGTRSEQLPDTTGMKSRVLIQAGHRYKYDRQVTMTGAELAEVGNANGVRADQMEEALDDTVAMIIHPSHLDGKPGTLPLEDVAALARAQGVPVFVDAAYMVYPTDLIGSYLPRGADMVAISAKYYGGPNAGGFIMGRADLIDAVSAVHFTRYESGQYLKYGRPLKMDRQTIVAVVAALDEWLAMDHDARHAKYAEQVAMLERDLAGVPGLTLAPKCFTMDERFVEEPVNSLLITVDEPAAGMTALAISDRLAEGDPSIAVIQEGDRIGVVMDVLRDDEVTLIGQRLRETVSAA